MPRMYWGYGPREPINGGATQTNSLGGGTCFPFLNLFKTAQGWAYGSRPTDTSLPPLPVLERDANGYCRYIPAGAGNVWSYYWHPPYHANEGIYVLDWDGIGTLTLAGGFDEAPGESQNLAALASATDAGGRVEFVRIAGNTNDYVRIFTTGTGPTNGDHIRNIRIFKKDDEELLDAGNVLSSKFKSDTLYAGPGALRSLGWIGEQSNGTNVCNLALWSHRKPTTHFTWTGDEYRPACMASIATVSGNNYSASLAGFTLTDKAVVHLVFGQESTNGAKMRLGEGQWTTTINSGSPGTITWTGHALVPDNAVYFQGPSPTFTVLPSPLQAGVRYYVKTVSDANTFTISATPGGTAINIASSASNINTVSPWMLSVQGSTPKPMIGLNYFTPESCFIGYGRLGDLATINPGYILRGMVCTVVYDATTDAWNLTGGYDNGFASGICGGVPPEIYLDACEELGCVPHFTAPMLTMEVGADIHAITDFMPSLAQLVKDRQDTTARWMKGIFEGPNEMFNDISAAFRNKPYSRGVSWMRWGTEVNYPYDTHGKWMSVMGQAISAIYGGDRDRYDVVMGWQTSGFHDSSEASYPAMNLLAKSERYVSANGGAPAHLWCTGGTIANYFGPADYYRKDFLDFAWDAYVTNRGNSAAQLAIAEDFAASALMSEPDATYNTQFNLIVATKAKAYFKYLGWTVMVGYEGGWSPDYLPDDPLVYITAASKATSCVLTVQAAVYAYGAPLSGGISGVKVGMCLTPIDVGGMTQLNNELLARGCSFPGGTTINATNTFVVDDAIAFSGGGPPHYTLIPPEISPGVAYYVKTRTGTTFTIAATKGGAAISLTATSPGYEVIARRGWRVTAVNAGTNTITLDVNSTAFGTYTTGGYAKLSAVSTLTSTLCYDVKYTENVGLANTQSFQNWFGLDEGYDGFRVKFFSNFLYYGLLNSWTIKDPDMWAPNTPQWESIHDWNSA